MITGVLGIPDPGVWIAYVLCILCALLCVGWGVAKWNAEDPTQEPDEEIRHWAEEEDKVEEKL